MWHNYKDVGISDQRSASSVKFQKFFTFENLSSVAYQKYYAISRSLKSIKHKDIW